MAAFYVVADLLLQTKQREPYRALVLFRLKSVKVSTDLRDRNLHSSSHRFQSSCSRIMQLDLLLCLFISV